MEIIKNGRNSKEGLKRKITFHCDNKDCECIFRESLNSNNIYVSIDEYGILTKKRKIIYKCMCPECGKVAIAIEMPDEPDIDV